VDETSPLPVPFVVLTGFLGAGKTTTLNRLLASAEGRRIAVLINDVGRIHIDRQLITRQEGDLIELSGGCVCCQLDQQRNLLDGMDDLIRRAAPDYLVLETTGIAEPPILLDAIESSPLSKKLVQVTGVICAVDAEAGAGQIERREEASTQVMAADRLLLTKLDLAGAKEVAALHEQLDRLNSEAERASFPSGREGDLGLTKWLLEPRHGRRPPVTVPHRHGQLTVVTFVEEQPLLRDPLLCCLESLGDALLRAKGFVRLTDGTRPFLERAGKRLSLHEGHAGGRTELVLIGEGLDEEAIRRQLWACRAAASTIS
jgi:G3E family GTPase